MLPPSAAGDAAAAAAAVGPALEAFALGPLAAPELLSLLLLQSLAGVAPVKLCFEDATPNLPTPPAPKPLSSVAAAAVTARASLQAWTATASGSPLLLLLTGTTWLHLRHVISNAKIWLLASATAAGAAAPACSISCAYMVGLKHPLRLVAVAADLWTAFATAVASFIRAIASAAAARLDAASLLLQQQLLQGASAAALADASDLAAATAVAERMRPDPQALSAASSAAAVHSGLWHSALARCLDLTARSRVLICTQQAEESRGPQKVCSPPPHYPHPAYRPDSAQVSLIWHSARHQVQ